MKNIKEMTTKEIEQLLYENCSKYDTDCNSCPYNAYCEEYAHRDNDDLYQIKDIIKEGKNGKFLAVCESGNTYECDFVAEYRTMFFVMPAYENIIGYKKIIGRM